MKQFYSQGRSRITVEPYRTEHSAYRYTVVDMLQNRIVIVTSDKSIAEHVARSLDLHSGDSALNISKSD